MFAIVLVIDAPLRVRFVGGAETTQVAERLHQQAENARLAFGAGMGGVFDFAFGARDLAAQCAHEAPLQRDRIERFIARSFDWRSWRRCRRAALGPCLALAQGAKRGGRELESGGDFRERRRAVVIQRTRTGERGAAGLFHVAMSFMGSVIASGAKQSSSAWGRTRPGGEAP